MNDSIDPVQARLQSIDSATLTPIIRKVLNDEALTITEWSSTSVHGGVGGGAGGTAVYRYSGTAVSAGASTPWSVILKVTSARPDEKSDSTHYWKREAEFYRAGLDVDVPGRFRPVHGYGVTEFPDEACWIWQEDVTGAIPGPWSIAEYTAHARNIGLFNAQYLNGRPAPQAPWMSNGWLRQIADATVPHVPKILDNLNLPHVREIFPADSIEQFWRLWNARESLLSTLDRLPQTLCHQDPVRRNLFLRPADDGYETIAIDWAYVGHAAIGVDIAVPLIIDPLFMEIDVMLARDLCEALFEGYLNGLRDGGWRGDTRRVRLAYLASASCKYIEVYMLGAAFNLYDLNMADIYPEMTGHTMEENMAVNAQFFRFMTTVVDEALDLHDI
ncbi:MAG: phosphotransferase [Chloroflexi bacterium]|nr:phosphotransferase [Chloroflexota bacterium]